MKRIYFMLFVWLIIGCTPSQPPAPIELSDAKRQDSLFLPLSEDDATFLIHESFLYLDTEYPYHLGVVGTAEDLKLPREARPVFYGAGGWASAIQTATGLVRLIKMYPAMDTTYQVSERLLHRITQQGILGEVDYLNNPFNRSSGRGGGWNNVLKLAIELQSWDHVAAPILLNNLQPLLALIEERTKDGLTGQVYPYRGSTANGLAILWEYADTFEKDQLKQLAEEKARGFFEQNAHYKLSEESSKSSTLSEGLEEINLMKLILTTAEYAQWLHAYSSEIFSNDFWMEPAVRMINEEEEEEKTNVMKYLDQADMLNLSRAKRLLSLAESDPDLKHLKMVAYDHIIQALWDAGTDDDLKIRVFHAQL